MGCAACARTCPIFFSHTLQLAYYFLLQLCFVVHVGVARVVVLLASVPGTEPLKKKKGDRTFFCPLCESGEATRFVESGLWWIHVESLKLSKPVSELLLSEPASALTSNPSKPSYSQ